MTSNEVSILNSLVIQIPLAVLLAVVMFRFFAILDRRDANWREMITTLQSRDDKKSESLILEIKQLAESIRDLSNATLQHHAQVTAIIQQIDLDSLRAKGR